MIKKSELNKELYNPRELAKFIGVSTRTIYIWGNVGRLDYKAIYKDGQVTKRMYTKETVINKLIELDLLVDDDGRQDVIYARVSTHKQKERGDLQRQIDNLKLFAIDQNPVNLLVISDVASGLNDNRKGLAKLINLVQTGNVKRIYISYKDRLTRFGFNYIKQICDFNQTEIVIVSTETTSKSLEFELAEDIISIIPSFSGKLYGLRNKVKLQVDKELSNDDDPIS